MIVDNIADIVLLIIMLVSFGVSIKRGLAREALMLASLLVSLYVAYKYGAEIGSYCTFLTAAVLRQGFGYFLAFSVTSVVTAAIRIPILQVIRFGTTNAIDRVAGGIFGIARGGVAVALLVSALNNTPIVQQTWWEGSFFIPHIEETSQKALTKVPEKWKHEVMAIVEKFDIEYV